MTNDSRTLNLFFSKNNFIGSFNEGGFTPSTITFLVHPTNRDRTNQLSKVASTTTHADENNTVSVQFLMHH